MRHRLALTLATLLVAAPQVRAQQAEQPAGQEERPDSVVAIVDGDPILASEIDSLIDFDPIAAAEVDDESERRERILQLLIGDRLRFHEIERLGLAEATAEDAERHLGSLLRDFPSYRTVLIRVRREGLDDPMIRRLLARQVEAATFIEERLGPAVFVTGDEIEAHYRQRLVPEYRNRGEAVPTLEEVREQIRSTLREARLLEEGELWTAELRQAAEIRLMVGDPAAD